MKAEGKGIFARKKKKRSRQRWRLNWGKIGRDAIKLATDFIQISTHKVKFQNLKKKPATNMLKKLSRRQNMEVGKIFGKKIWGTGAINHQSWTGQSISGNFFHPGSSSLRRPKPRVKTEKEQNWQRQDLWGEEQQSFVERNEAGASSFELAIGRRNIEPHPTNEFLASLTCLDQLLPRVALG